MSELSEKLKKVGLDVAERHLTLAVDDIYALAQVLVEDSANPLDDSLLEGLKLFKSTLKDYVDKLDGEEG